jgi:hypothetical protein
MQDLDIARWRLLSQHLVWPYAVSAREAVGSLLAVQAENPSQAAWAVASRTQNPDQAELAALLDDGTVLRTHVLRPTWHFVRAEDAGWLLDLTGPAYGGSPASSYITPMVSTSVPSATRPPPSRRHWRAEDSSPARSWLTSCAIAVSQAAGKC